MDLPRASKTSLLKTGGSLTSFTVILTLTHGSDWSIWSVFPLGEIGFTLDAQMSKLNSFSTSKSSSDFKYRTP